MADRGLLPRCPRDGDAVLSKHIPRETRAIHAFARSVPTPAVRNADVSLASPDNVSRRRLRWSFASRWQINRSPAWARAWPTDGNVDREVDRKVDTESDAWDEHGQCAAALSVGRSREQQQADSCAVERSETHAANPAEVYVRQRSVMSGEW